jgi:hypothetical protein
MHVCLGMRRGPYASFVLMLSLAASGGCSSRGTVSGKVTLQTETETKTVRGGTVIFMSADNKSLGTSAIAEDGSYSIAKVPRGTVKVGVETESARPVSGPPADVTVAKPPAGAPLPPGAASSPLYEGAGKTDRYVEIPEKYNNPEKSGITFEATGTNQTHDIKLKEESNP